MTSSPGCILISLSCRRHHYEDSPSPSERRFDNINTLPQICTKVKYCFGLSKGRYVAKCDIGRMSPRKEVHPVEQVPCMYSPSKEAVLRKDSYCTRSR